MNQNRMIFILNKISKSIKVYRNIAGGKRVKNALRFRHDSDIILQCPSLGVHFAAVRRFFAALYCFIFVVYMYRQ